MLTIGPHWSHITKNTMLQNHQKTHNTDNSNSSSNKRECRKSDSTLARILKLRFSNFQQKKNMKHAKNMDVVVHICNLSNQEAVIEL